MIDKLININWSYSSKLITSITIIIIIGTFYYVIKNGYLKTSILTPIILISVIGILIYFISQSPTSIRLTDNKFILNKIIGKIEIPYSNIQDIKEYKFTNQDIRIMGSGGFFGYLGTFKNNTFGKYSCYVGNTEQAFYIQTKENKYYVISSGDNKEVINIILKKIDK